MVKDIMWKFMLSKRAGSYVRTMSWLSISSVALSLAALILISSVMNGFNNSMLNNIVAAEPDLVITHDNNSDKIDELLSEMEVQSIQKVSMHDVIIKTIDGNFGGAIAKGMTPEAIDDFFSGLKGSYKKEFNLQPGQVILGEDLARSLGVLNGDEIIVLPPDALIESSGENFVYDKVIVADKFTTQVENLDKNIMLYAKKHTLLAAENSRSFTSQTEVQLFDPFLANNYKKKLVAEGLKLETWGDRNSALILALKLEKIAMNTFLTLGALITSFSIATVLVLLINQKKREWGVLMTMGLSRVRTRDLFTRIGMYLSSIGVVAGFVLGLGLALFLKLYKPCVLPDYYYDCTIPVEIRPSHLAIIFGLSILITFLASFIPAQIYSKLKPYESIRS